MTTVLIVDDEPSIRRTLRDLLELQGFDVKEAENGKAGLDALGSGPVDLLLLDVMMPVMDGITALRTLRETSPELPVIMLTAHATIETAVEATRLGAFDFLQKPPPLNRLLIVIRNALEHGRLHHENARFRSALARNQGDAPVMIGDGPSMRRVRRLVERAAPSDARVLITGEPGTGKELVARWIHGLSGRRDGSLVAVNCAAIPTELIESELFGHEQGSFTGAVKRQIGTFEQADGGTLFLDEVGDMSPNAQAKVLRALESGVIRRVGGDRDVRVDVRVVCATNRDLEKDLDEGRFREDLFHRLSVIQIHVPPLRERPDDIPALVGFFCSRLSSGRGGAGPRFETEAVNLLSRMPWRGNVRELRNAVERLLVLAEGDVVTATDVSSLVGSRRRGTASMDSLIDTHAHLTEFRDAAERSFLERKLAQFDWNVSRTADEIDLQRSNLYARIRRFGLERP